MDLTWARAAPQVEIAEIETGGPGPPKFPTMHAASSALLFAIRGHVICFALAVAMGSGRQARRMWLDAGLFAPDRARGLLLLRLRRKTLDTFVFE